MNDDALDRLTVAVDAIPVEGTKCKDCDFVIPKGTKHAVNSMISHKRNAHQGWAEMKRVKPQFQALIEATGGFDTACYFADRVILWNRPDDDTLRNWAIEAETREDAGFNVITQSQIDRIERRLRRVEEWRTRKTLDGYRNAADTLAKEVAETGTTAKPQLAQYMGMNVQLGTKEIAAAYPAPVGKTRKRSGGTKVVGGKPPQKALPAPPEKTVEGQFRVIEETVANSDS